MKILVSACLLGEKCKYDGESNFNETVAAFCRGKEVIAVCPEFLPVWEVRGCLRKSLTEK